MDRQGHVDRFYQSIRGDGCIKINYYDYIITELINCVDELKRLFVQHI